MYLMAVVIIGHTPTIVHAQPAAALSQAAVRDQLVASPEKEVSANVSLDFKDADINNVLRILSLKSRVNIVAGPEVQGSVTIRLEDVPWNKALDVVLRTYGYVYEREENIIRVTTKENLATEELVTDTFVLNYTTAEEAQEAIEDILTERGRVRPVPRTNMLVVTDIPTNLFKIREVISRLDRSTPQAYIDAKIIKTSLQEGENLGIQWGTAITASGSERPATFPFKAFNKEGDSSPFERALGDFFPANIGAAVAANAQNQLGFPSLDGSAAPTFTGATPFTFGTLDFTSFQAVLQFLKTRSNTREISNPRVTVLNNQTASINVGKEIPLPTLERNETSGSFEITGFEYRETGVVLEVTPHINDANEILVELAPEISSSTTSTSFGAGDFTSIPNFDVETAKTQVLIRSGETIAVGGLRTHNRNMTETKVPILGDVPIIGKLFRSKRQAQDATNQTEETLFFVTVTIVDTEGEPVQIYTKNVSASPSS
jgi:type IV pilus assembly protein PilQ